MYICAHTHTHTNTHTHAYIHTNTHIHIDTDIIYAHTYIQHTHARTHTQTHTHTASTLTCLPDTVSLKPVQLLSFCKRTLEDKMSDRLTAPPVCPPHLSVQVLALCGGVGVRVVILPEVAGQRAQVKL